MTDLDALITRLWNAEEPNRELDYLIYGWSKGWRLPSKDHPFSWTVLNKFQYGDPANDRAAIYIHESELPELTTSIDAALALVEQVLPGWEWSVCGGYNTQAGEACLWRKDTEHTGWQIGNAVAIAILIAMLEALKARGDD